MYCNTLATYRHHLIVTDLKIGGLLGRVYPPRNQRKVTALAFAGLHLLLALVYYSVCPFVYF